MLLMVQILYKTVGRVCTKLGDIKERSDRLQSPLLVSWGVLTVSGIR